MIDISKEEVLMQYLKEHAVIDQDDDAKIHYCKGGVSCTVAYVECKDKPMIIKQALKQLKTKDAWLCDPNRMNVEYEANKIYFEYMPKYTPRTYFYDADNYIYGREAVPDGCKMWKEDLMNRIVDSKIAIQAIDVLSMIHKKCFKNPEIEEKFGDKKIFYSLRISPYIEFTVQKYPEIQELAQKVIDQMMNHSMTLIHGDYSPKNIMINDGEIKVLDYEVAHYGHPAFDLAFFCNHFLLKSVKFYLDHQKYLDVLDEMVNRYFKTLDYMDQKEFEEIFIQTLQILLLARIDGKSPVEYLIDEEKKKEMVRKISLQAIDQEINTYQEFREYFEDCIKGGG